MGASLPKWAVMNCNLAVINTDLTLTKCNAALQHYKLKIFSCCNMQCCSKSQMTQGLLNWGLQQWKDIQTLEDGFLHIQICRYINTTNITQWAVVQGWLSMAEATSADLGVSHSSTKAAHRRDWLCMTHQYTLGMQLPVGTATPTLISYEYH